MSVQDEIARIAAAKADIASALEEKGVSVAEGTKLDEMGDMVRSIPTGGEENVIESVSVNSIPLPITNKNVNIDLSGYVNFNESTTISKESLSIDFANSTIKSTSDLYLKGVSIDITTTSDEAYIVLGDDDYVTIYSTAGIDIMSDGYINLYGNTNVAGSLSVNGNAVATKSYAEACASSMGTAANNYTDSQVSDAKAYADTVSSTNASTALSQAKSYTDSEISDVWDKIYPVGSIYISTDSTSPASLFGGSWATITNRFLLAQGSSYAAGSTGGSATVTLTVANMPSHEGHLYDNTAAPSTGNIGTATGKFVSSLGGSYGTNGRGWNDLGSEYYPAGVSRGSGTAHNNMPPYQAVYMWKRMT